MRRILVGLVGAALLAGCTPEAPATSSPAPTPSVESSAPAPSVEAPSPSPSASPSESPSPSQSPSPTAVESFPPAPATETPEQAEVRAAWMNYNTQFSRYAATPELSDLTDLTELVTDVELPETIGHLQRIREAGEVLVGGFTYRDVQVTVPHPELGTVDTAMVAYCVDRSALVIQDVDTQELISRELSNLEEQSTFKLVGDRWLLDGLRNRQSEC